MKSGPRETLFRVFVSLGGRFVGSSVMLCNGQAGCGLVSGSRGQKSTKNRFAGVLVEGVQDLPEDGFRQIKVGALCEERLRQLLDQTRIEQLNPLVQGQVQNDGSITGQDDNEPMVSEGEPKC